MDILHEMNSSSNSRISLFSKFLLNCNHISTARMCFICLFWKSGHEHCHPSWWTTFGRVR